MAKTKKSKQRDLHTKMYLYRVSFRRPHPAKENEQEVYSEFHVARDITDVWEHLGCDPLTTVVGVREEVPVLSVIYPVTAEYIDEDTKSAEKDVTLKEFISWVEGVHSDWAALKPDAYDDDPVQREVRKSIEDGRRFIEDFKRQHTDIEDFEHRPPTTEPHD